MGEGRGSRVKERNGGLGAGVGGGRQGGVTGVHGSGSGGRRGWEGVAGRGVVVEKGYQGGDEVGGEIEGRLWTGLGGRSRIVSVPYVCVVRWKVGVVLGFSGSRFGVV